MNCKNFTNKILIAIDHDPVFLPYEREVTTEGHYEFLNIAHDVVGNFPFVGLVRVFDVDVVEQILVLERAESLAPVVGIGNRYRKIVRDLSLASVQVAFEIVFQLLVTPEPCGAFLHRLH